MRSGWWLWVAFVFLATPLSCKSKPPTAAKRQVRIVFGAVPWVDALLSVYSQKLPDIQFSRTDPPDSVSSLDYIEEGLGDVSFVQADVVYSAFNKGTHIRSNPHRKLRGMAVLHLSALHFIAAPGKSFRTLEDLRGKRIGIGPQRTSSAATVPVLLKGLGIDSTKVQFDFSPFNENINKMTHGALDGEFIFSAFPAESAEAALAVPGVHLVSIPEAEIGRLHEQSSFLRPVTIPAGTYGQSEDVGTVGVEFLFVCREDLDEDVVYQMLSVFFDSVNELARLRPPLRTISFNQAPETPIPLHPGAARFYREYQLFH